MLMFRMEIRPFKFIVNEIASPLQSRGPSLKAQLITHEAHVCSPKSRPDIRRRRDFPHQNEKKKLYSRRSVGIATTRRAEVTDMA